ncbi:hypothetical protein G4Y79_01800 [Phototrophicus methaneseepsis]|uniref:Uncharacterized protein n=1 Tax=Phototrophicus methaneseepsis TaxID=2710758 RepID=A0A7S8EA79_9CHLR|nr:hypothetical protein G4Y79_01800 [Phototrophicus methaneseepsis]
MPVAATMIAMTARQEVTAEHERNETQEHDGAGWHVEKDNRQQCHEQTNTHNPDNRWDMPRAIYISMIMFHDGFSYEI